MFKKKILATAYQYTQTIKRSNNQIHSNKCSNAYQCLQWSSLPENASECLSHAYQRRKAPKEFCSCLSMPAANEYCSGVTTYPIYFATICQTLSSSTTVRCLSTLDHSEMLLLLWLCLYRWWMARKSSLTAELGGCDAPKVQYSDVSTVITPFETLRPRYLEVHSLYVEAPLSLNLPWYGFEIDY